MYRITGLYLKLVSLVLRNDSKYDLTKSSGTQYAQSILDTGNGLYYLDKGKNICPEKTVNKKIQSVSVFGIFRDRQDKLWIGTYGDGIYVFDKSNLPSPVVKSEESF